MFGGGLWGSFAGSDDHLTREREPPPRPIDLEFPAYVPPFQPRPLNQRTSSRLRHKICHTRSFTDIEDSDLADLNIKLILGANIDSLIPSDQFPTRPFLYDDDLQAMIDEIKVDNRDAFREVLRMQPLPGRKKPRLAYARNFFGSLEDMARYFDNSLDEYYPVPADKSKRSPSNEGDAHASDGENSESERNTTNESGTKEVYKGYRISNAETMNPGTRIAMTKNFLKLVMHKFQCRDHEPMPQPREKFTFRGVRLQSIQYPFCVARIPRDTKQARARMVEGPIMAVHVRDELRFKAKTGLQIPGKTGFTGERFDLLREVGCMLIIASQRAREEKDPNQIDHSSKQWWVSRERWGGGATKWGQLSCDVYEDEDPSASPEEYKLREARKLREQEEQENSKAFEKIAAVETKSIDIDDLLARVRESSPSATMTDLRPRRKKPRGMEQSTDKAPAERDGRRLMYVPPMRRRWYQDWQKLRPNAPTLDEKIIARRIGNEDNCNSGYDEVFMLSSCNHHLSLCKLRVHEDYLEWLESGKEVTDLGHALDGKAIISLTRSAWYDMFDIQKRQQFLVALWRLMCWLNKNEVPQVEIEKMEARKAGTEAGVPAGPSDVAAI